MTRAFFTRVPNVNFGIGDWFKISRHFLIQLEVKSKANRDALAHVIPRFVPRPATCIKSEFDWFTGLSVFFVIGQSDYF